mgnify:FL=1
MSMLLIEFNSINQYSMYMNVSEYEKLRRNYKPDKIRYLLIAESPPPPPEFEGSRHFYRTDRPRRDDRLFLNTVRAIYSGALNLSDDQLEQDKENWLERLKQDGFYMTESLEESVKKVVKKPERQERIKKALPRLISRVEELADEDTKIVLIKSNVFEVACEPLEEAGFNVLNKALVDYPGFWNQKAYREKLSDLIKS